MMRFVVLGGFLGAGKTTALLRLAGYYAGRGLRVGIIANDQADGLVDSETFRAAGFATEEVPRGCFCCRFNDLIAAAGRLGNHVHPDVLLAEPVGSCTDLVSTVITPLRRLYADRFDVAPYVVLLDPERAMASLGGKGRLSDKVTYIYQMQQQEADIVAINKVDTLTPERLSELRELVRRNFPSARVLEISARTGAGFEELISGIEASAARSRPSLEIDYDTYAEGEARLGWLNCRMSLQASSPLNAGDFVVDLAETIRAGLAHQGSEPAHVKIRLEANGAAAVANVVAGDRPAELARPSQDRISGGDLLINARVECPPELLQACVESSLAELQARYDMSVTNCRLQAFAPGRPVPTHRMTEGRSSTPVTLGFPRPLRDAD